MNYVTVEMECPLCGDYHYVACREDGFEAWQDCELIQYALPELSATEREQLISRLCPDCQELIFGADE